MEYRAVDVSRLVQGRERVYLALIVLIQLSLLAGIALTGTWLVLAYFLVAFAIAGVAHGMLVGYLRGSAVRIDEHQFPDLHERLHAAGKQLGMTRIPEAYILQGDGLLNAFATHFFGRRYVVLYSDIVEPAYDQGPEVVDFIVAHELAHHRRGHVTKLLLLWPARLMPLLGKAYSRACEYTCDRIAVAAVPQAGPRGLALLAAGKRLYGQLDTRSYAEQSQRLGGFWTWAAELLSTHPHLSRRIRAIERAPQTHGLVIGPDPAASEAP